MSPIERLPLDERRRRIRAAQRAAAEGVEPARGTDRVSALSVVVSGLLALAGLGFAVLVPAALGADHILPAGWAVVVSMFVAGGAAFVAVVQLVSGGAWIVVSMTTAAVASFIAVLAIVAVTSIPGHATGGATTTAAVVCWLGLAMAIRARREATRA